MLHWYAKHGVPSRVTCDNGSNFTSGYWTTLQAELGIKVAFTPPYHSQSLGSVERQHKDLKVGLRARIMEAGGGWYKHLPHVLLGRATAYQSRFDTSAAVMVYGTHLQVPGDLLAPSAEGTSVDAKAMVARMQMEAARPPKPTTPFHYKDHFPESAAKASHVYVKKVKTPLGPLKAGPFPIIRREGKSALILDVGRKADGSPREELQHWANCQPAVLAADTKAATRVMRGRKPRHHPGLKQGPQASPTPTPATTPSISVAPPTQPESPSLAPSAAEAPAPAGHPTTTRSGRRIKPKRKEGFIYV